MSDALNATGEAPLQIHEAPEPALDASISARHPSLAEIPDEDTGVSTYVPPEPSKTMIYAPPESPEAGQGAPDYVPPEPSKTVLYAPPEPTKTVVYAAPTADDDVPRTQVLDVESVQAPSRHVEQAEEPTRIVALREFDNSPTRIISLHALFADKTQPIPQAEILSLARAAQEAAREAVRAPSEAPAPAPKSSSSSSAKRARGRAAQARGLETSAGSLPPRAWSTNVREPEPELIARPPAPASPPPRVKEASVAKAKAPELSEAVFLEHFEGAAEALRQMDPSESGRELGTLTERAQARWLSNFEVLKLNGELAARLVLLPSLFDAERSEIHRLTAALALLSMKGGSGLLDAIENFDAVCHRVVTTALAYLDDGVSAESIAAMGSAVTDAEARLAWLRVFVRRSVDPGAELVHELLGSQERDMLAMGLRLLPLHADARPLAAQIDRHMLSNKPEIRNAALIAGLTLDRPSAWMQCKQAARAPDSAEPCLLVAALGTDKDRARLVSWAKRAAAPGYVGWALGACGHPAGVAASLALAEHKDEAFGELALAGFVISTGADVDTLGDAQRWWDAHQGELEAGRRYLRGQPFTTASLAASLQQGSLRWREAIALELLVRSRGEERIPSVFMPSRVAALAEQIEALELDFEASYQVRRGRA